MSKIDTPATPSQAARPSLWKRRPYLISFLVLLILAVTSGLIYYSVTSRTRLEEAFTEADTMDPGWRLQEIEAKRLAVPDNQNSALVLMAAKQLMPSQWPVWQDKSFPENKNRREEEVLALQKVFANPDPPVQLRDNELQLLREELKRAAPALAEARKVIDLPHGRYPIEYSKDFLSTVVPHTQDARTFANLLAYDAMLRAQDKDVDGALTSCRGILRVSDSIGDEPTAISMIVRIGIRQLALRQIERVLAQGQPSEASLASIQQLLEAEEKEPLLVIGLRGERAGMDTLMQAIQNGDVNLARLYEGLGGGVYSINGARTLVLPGAVNYDRAALLHWYNIAVGRAGMRTVEGQRLALEQHEAEARNLPPLARLLQVSWSGLGRAWFRDQASMRCVIALVATERFRLAQGRWPHALGKLKSAGYLATVPTDPYSVAELRIQRVPDGIGIYSVGEGATMGAVPATAGHASTAPAPDSGFRLWNVDKRRQLPQKPGK